MCAIPENGESSYNDEFFHLTAIYDLGGFFHDVKITFEIEENPRDRVNGWGVRDLKINGWNPCLNQCGTAENPVCEENGSCNQCEVDEDCITYDESASCVTQGDGTTKICEFICDEDA